MKTKKVLTSFLAKSFDHICCDERGNVLAVHEQYMDQRSMDAGKPVYDDPTFLLNGKTIDKGQYLHFDLHNGNYAISKEENDDEIGIWINGNRVYSLKKPSWLSQGGIIQRERNEMSTYWQLLNGKLLTSENGNLLYDGNLLLKKGAWSFAKIFGDSIFGYRLFVSQSYNCFEVDLLEGRLIPIQSPGLQYIGCSQGKLLTFSEGKFFVDKEPFFDLEKYLYHIGGFKKTSVPDSFDYKNGMLALLFFNDEFEEQPFTIHLIDKNGNIIDKRKVNIPLLINGKIVQVNNTCCIYGNCRYDLGIEYPQKVYCSKVINNHLFMRICYDPLYYKVNLPE